MKPFLEEITEYVLKHFPGKTGEICLVSPNRRAGLFFRKYFAEKVNTPIWSPDILSIEDFINRISGLKVTDSTSLLFIFYEVYRELEKEDARPIDEFLRWAPVLLNDIDEIDANLDAPQKLFEQLSDIRQVETWNPDGTPLTEFQKRYLAFFNSFKRYHDRLKERLLEQGLAYQGLSSRMAAAAVASEDFVLPWEKVLFVGFNALNQSEEAIVSTLIDRHQAFFITDSDPWYTNDPDHEAGLFIRKYARMFRLQPPALESMLAGSKKNISIMGIAKNVNQARLAGNILDAVPSLIRDEHTAIVLASENLLIPVLNALPGDAGSINVTMGYPLNKTNMYGFFEALWKMHLFVSKRGPATGDKGPSFYYKDLIRLLGHSCTAILLDIGHGRTMAGELIKHLKQAGKPFVQFQELAEMATATGGFSERLDFLDEDWSNNMSGIFTSLLTLVSRLDKAFREKAGAQGRDIVNTPFFVDFEALYYFAGIFRRMQAFMEKHPFLESISTIFTLFKQLTAETRLSFSGEPLQGLQVMGMLETRNLDFKNVILLSANENILPKPKGNQSFIPYDVKKRFGLQVHSDKDAIYAYHFYRLLQRAEQVYIIYNTQAEDIGSSEKSRFITQLLMELKPGAPQISMHEAIVSMPPPASGTGQSIVIEKTEGIMQRLASMCKSGFSPSALNTFINCPLQFYFTRVAKIEEPGDVEETIEATTMGTVVHGVLETLYSPYLNNTLGTDALTEMQKQAEGLVMSQFAKHYQGGSLLQGKNLLLMNLAKRYVSNFLKSEKQYVARIMPGTLKIVAMEKQLQATLEAEVCGQTISVSIKGMADRIDRVGSTLRIIDYKTGKVGLGELGFKEWDKVIGESKYGKVFQLLTYAWLYHQMHPDTHDVEPGIFSLREPTKGLQTITYPGGKGNMQPGQLASFEEQLRLLLASLLDPNQPFEQTSNDKNCQYCPFREVCRRF